MRHVRQVDALKLIRTALSPAPADVRQRGRFRTHLLTSQFGPVLDLSRGGVRIHCGRGHGLKEGEVVRVELSCPGLSVAIDGMVRWVRKAGWFSAIAGVQFTNVTPEVEAVLRDLFRMTMDDRLPGSVLPD